MAIPREKTVEVDRYPSRKVRINTGGQKSAVLAIFSLLYSRTLSALPVQQTQFGEKP